MKRPLYLSTTLPYVNADPHIGFALEIVHADIFARFRKLRGDDVFFNTGTDEHGLKIYRKAQEEGRSAQEYVDEYAAKFRALKEVLGLSPDLHFIRTTDPHHIDAAQQMWRRCNASGDIYKKKYKGLYCVGDEAFVKESDLTGGKCPNHPTMELMEIEEENYFFKLSGYQEKLTKYLSQEGAIVPEWRRQEALQFVARGLEDFSISREKARLPWGIAVPDDESQVMYVWFDALTNYISTLGWPLDSEGNFKKFWVEGETIQVAGKDQVRFQSIMWQAMLLSAALPTTQKIMYHGFVTSGGQKMSKSIGNVIDPLTLQKEYGTDALRLFLARHISPFEDTDVTLEAFKAAYNADLANGLGNQVARVMKLAEQYLDRPADIPQEMWTLQPPFIEALEKYDIAAATNMMWHHIAKTDTYIQEKQPFKLVKSQDEAVKEEGIAIIKRLVGHIAMLATHLEPIVPETADKIKEAVRTNKMPPALFARKD